MQRNGIAYVWFSPLGLRNQAARPIAATTMMLMMRLQLQRALALPSTRNICYHIVPVRHGVFFVDVDDHSRNSRFMQSTEVEADERSRLAEAADGDPPYDITSTFTSTCTPTYVTTPVIFAETLLARSGHGRGVLNAFICALKVSQAFYAFSNQMYLPSTTASTCDTDRTRLLRSLL